MPRRSDLDVETLASIETLSWAFWRASRQRRHARDVRSTGRELAALGRDLRLGRAPEGRFTQFTIRDPKLRRIHAPCFRDRVAHHAIMAHVGPVLERRLVADTFACRLGGGTHAAVARAQQHCQRFPWFAKLDVRAYFASIDHQLLVRQLTRVFKHPALLELLARVVHHGGPPKGLPIGALTSQYFANSFLGPVDRFVLEQSTARGMVRYMDDIVIWGDHRAAVRRVARQVREVAWEQCNLDVKESVLVGLSKRGVPMLGVRVYPGRVGLGRRRRRRFRAALKRAEGAWSRGELTALELQRFGEAAVATTMHADALHWRRAELSCRPLVVV